MTEPSFIAEWQAAQAEAREKLAAEFERAMQHPAPAFVVVGCGKQKREQRSEARDLYTGALFVAARRYVEAAGVPWAILSAEHGLVRPSDELDPYDRKLRLRGVELVLWARTAAERCVERLDECGARPSSVEVLMGHPYAWPFRNELLWAPGGVPSTEPLEGLGLGLRLQWLRVARHSLEEG